MPNHFFDEEDLIPSPDTSWRSLLADKLRSLDPFEDLYAAAVYSTPEIYLYSKAHFRPYGAKLVLRMEENGLGVGFYIERGYLWAAEAGWTLQPHWDWHHFVFLFRHDPGFLQLFRRAKEEADDFAIRIHSGDSDSEVLSFYASDLPFAAILGLLNSWPGHLWCDVYYAAHITHKALLNENDGAILDTIIRLIATVEPIYRAVLNRKMEIDARISNFAP